MALSDRNIVITPNIGQSNTPRIVFSGADAATGPQNVTLQVLHTNSGTIAIDGPSTSVIAIQGSGNVGIGTGANSLGAFKLETVGSGSIATARFSDTFAGNSFEIYGDSTVLLTSYNRTSATWLPLRLRSLQTEFYISGSEVMRLNSSGYLGIGTSTPATPLHAVGGPAGTAGWNRTATLQATYPILVFNGNNSRWAGIGYDSGFGIRVWGNATSADVSAISPLLTILNDGTVGIGRSSPVVGLDIFTAAAQVRLQSTGTSSEVRLNPDWAGTDLGAVGTASNSPFMLFTANTERIRITSAGNVGIGTTSPGYRLTIQGDSAAFHTQTAGNSATYYAGFRNNWDYSEAMTIYSRGGGNENKIIKWGDAAGLGLNGGAGPVKLEYNGTEYARLHTNGNFGVGTAAPTQALHVVGTGLASTDFRAPIFYDSGNTGYYVDPAGTSILTNVRATSYSNDAAGSLRVSLPGGASYVNASGTVTGAIKITLPVSWTNTMLRFTVKIYEYNSNESFDVHCGGYNYEPGGGSWINTFAYIVGNPSTNLNFAVRFGHDGTKCCVYIGETSTSWSYPQVGVIDFQAGYSAFEAANWDDGWSIIFATSLGTITSTITNSQVGRFANIFYDSDNTSYYLDPSSSSILSKLTVGTTTPTDVTLGINGAQHIAGTNFLYFGGSIGTSGGWGTREYQSSGVKYLNAAAFVFDNTGYTGSYSAWSLVSGTGGNITASADFRAPIFYDSGDTGYYFDGNSTSSLNILNVNGIVSQDTRSTATTPQSFNNVIRWDFKANTTNGLSDGGSFNGAMYWRTYGSGTDWSGLGAVEISYSANARLWMRYGSSTSWGSWKRVLFGDSFDNGGVITTSGDIRAPVFYDSANTGFYVDPNGVTNIELLTATRFGVNPSGASNNGYGISLYGGYTAGEPTYGLMFQGTGTFGTYGSVSADWATYFTMSNTAGRGWIFRNVGTGNVAGISAQGQMTLGSHLELGNNFGMPNIEWSSSSATGMVIFYLPGTTSNYGMVHMVFDIYEYNSPRIATVIIGGHNWSTQWYNIACNVVGFTDKQVRVGVKNGRFVVVFGTSGSSWTYGTIRLRKIHNAGFYDNVMNMTGDWTTEQTATESFSYVSGDLRGLRTPASFTADSDVRSPIFYDSANTGFYLDPASTSQISYIRTGNVINIGGVLGDGSIAGVNAHGIELHSEGDRNYFIGKPAGAWTQPLNINFFTGIRLQAHPSYDSGTSIWNMSSGVMMFSAGAGDNAVRIYADIRSPIYYDLNNTGYYFDGASTSKWNVSNQDGFHTFNNFGIGIVGTYSSVRYQCVFAMGDAYKGAANGTSLSGAYGLWWSYPDAGGPAANLTSHGLMCIVNGTFYASLDASTRAISDMRTPIFYDLNNTGYYLDPASLTSLRTVGSWRSDSSSWDGEFSGKIQYHSSIWYLQAATGWQFRNSGGTQVLYCDSSGNLTAAGNVTAYSDLRLKSNITKLDSASKYLTKLEAKRFTWNIDGRKDIGFIAQDVESAGLSELVIENENYDPSTETHTEPIKSLDYGRMVAVLWQIVKEQQDQIEEFRSRLAAIEAK